MAEAQIRTHQGVPTLFVDGQPQSAFAYVGDIPERCRAMGMVGLRLLSFVTRTQFAFYPDHPDPVLRDEIVAEHDALIRGLIDVWPEVRFFPRIQLEAPPWWGRRHWREVTYYDAPGVGPIPILARRRHAIPSWSSDVWRTHTRAALRGYIEHVHASDYGDRFIGYHLASGTSAEWMAFGSNGGLLVDYSKPAREAWRAWLRRRYGHDVNAFRAAWGIGGVSFEAAPVPSHEQRIAFDGQWLLDPKRHRPIIDYWEFYSDLTTDTIGLLAREAKEVTDRKAFVGVFYGYVLQLCNEHRQQNAGHMAIRKLLDCPDVDFVSSPSHYGNRRIGTGYSSFMCPVESVKLHGKLWYNENDFMSPLGERGAEDSGADTVEAYIEVQKACYASVLCNGVSQWLLGFNEGWYDHPQIRALIRRQQAIDDEALSWDRTSTNEIAIVVDDKSQLHQPVANLLPYIDRDSASRLLIYDLPPRVGRCGCGVDWMLLDDLDQARPYKVYIVLNAFHLDDKRRAMVKWRLCRGGATVLWMYAPGAIAETISADGVADMTGMRVAMSTERVPVRVVMDSGGHPLTSGSMARTRHIGDGTAIAPRFWIDDPRATVIGRSAHDGRPVCAVREFDDWRSVYLASAVTLDERFIRELARWAGVHVYYDGPDATYIGPNLIAIHAQTGGHKVIRLPAKSTVRALYEDRVISVDTDRIDLDLEPHQTRLFRFTHGG